MTVRGWQCGTPVTPLFASNLPGCGRACGSPGCAITQTRKPDFGPPSDATLHPNAPGADADNAPQRHHHHNRRAGSHAHRPAASGAAGHKRLGSSIPNAIGLQDSVGGGSLSDWEAARGFEEIRCGIDRNFANLVYFFSL
jgi:hypothetical protein